MSTLPSHLDALSDRARREREETIAVFLQTGLRPHPSELEWVKKQWGRHDNFAVCHWLGTGPYGRFTVDVIDDALGLVKWKLEFPQRHPCPVYACIAAWTSEPEQVRQRILHFQGKRGVPEDARPPKYDQWGNRVTGPWEREPRAAKLRNRKNTLWDDILEFLGFGY